MIIRYHSQLSLMPMFILTSRMPPIIFGQPTKAEVEMVACATVVTALEVCGYSSCLTDGAACMT